MGKRKRVLSEPTSQGSSPWLVALLVAVLGFLLYLPSLRSGFVYDAEAQVEIGDYIHQPAHFGEVLSLRVMSRDVLDFNRPVQLFSLMLDSLIWGKNPLGYHLTSNLLHAVVASLVFLLGVRLLGADRIWPSFLAAMVFVAHPVLVEPVAEVSSREDVLATLFVLFALLAADGFGRSAGRARVFYGVGCVVSAFLACASKETGFAAFPAVGLYWILFRWKESKGPWVALLAALFAATVAFFVARFALEPRDSQIFLHQPGYIGGSLKMVFEIQPRIWAFLLGLIFWPLHLSADYVPQNVAGLTLGLAWGILGVFLILQIVLSWKSRVAALGCFLFWLGLAPVSNFIPIFRPIADRFLYLPMVGVALALAGALALSTRPGVSKGFAVVVSCVVLFLAGLSWQRQAVFADSYSLWQDTLKKSPFSETAANNLGYACMERGEYDPALKAFEQALQITNGKKADAWAGVAMVFEKAGRPAEAENAMSQAVANDPVYGTPRKMLKALSAKVEHVELMEQILARKSP